MRHVCVIMLVSFLGACQGPRPKELVVHPSVDVRLAQEALQTLQEEFDCTLLDLVPAKESDWVGRWPTEGRVTMERIAPGDVPHWLDMAVNHPVTAWTEYPLPARDRARIFFVPERPQPDLIDIMHELLHAVLIGRGHYGEQGLLGSERVTREISDRLRKDVEEKCL